MKLKLVTLLSFLLVNISTIYAQLKVEHISMITTPVLLLKGNKVVSQGTGFYYAFQDTTKKRTLIFLVTNYHVLTGSAPGEKKAPIGDNIEFFFHKDIDKTGDLKKVRYPLFTKFHKPLWVSSKTNPEVDVAVIPLLTIVYKDCKVFGISDDWIKPPLKLRPSSKITLVGYPYGIEDKVNGLPIWKTGSIASEPNVDFDGKPLFVVDVSAFPGMSGSPVFAVSYGGTYEMTGGKGISTGSAQKFLGIYSSMEMLHEKKFIEEFNTFKDQGIVVNTSLQLGHVWKARLISEIVKSVDIEKYERDIIRNLE